MYALTYTIAILGNQQARSMGQVYTICFVASAAASFCAAALDDQDLYLPISALALAVELLMEPVAFLVLPASSILPIDVHHNIERAELWAIVVIGESFLSLVHGSESYFEITFGFLTSVALGFSIVFCLMTIYSKSSPEEHTELDSHAYDVSRFGSIFFDKFQLLTTLGLFGTGVGLKFVCKFGHYKEGKKYTATHAFLLTSSVAIALLGATLIRLCHAWTDYQWGRSCMTRKRLWFFNVLVAVSIVPLALMISTDYAEDGMKYRDGYHINEFLAAVFAALLLPLALDHIALPPESVLQDLKLFLEAKARLQSGKLAYAKMEGTLAYTKTYQRSVEAAVNQVTATGRIKQQGQKQFRFTVSSALCSLSHSVPLPNDQMFSIPALPHQTLVHCLHGMVHAVPRVCVITSNR